MQANKTLRTLVACVCLACGPAVAQDTGAEPPQDQVPAPTEPVQDQMPAPTAPAAMEEEEVSEPAEQERSDASTEPPATDGGAASPPAGFDRSDARRVSEGDLPEGITLEEGQLVVSSDHRVEFKDTYAQVVHRTGAWLMVVFCDCHERDTWGQGNCQMGHVARGRAVGLFCSGSCTRKGKSHDCELWWVAR